MIKNTDTLTNAKILIYIMLNSLMKINPNYFSQEAMLAIIENEKELIEAIKDWDEQISVNDLVIALFKKAKLH